MAVSVLTSVSQRAQLSYLCVKVPIPVRRFQRSDWPILEILINHVTNVP